MLEALRKVNIQDDPLIDLVAAIAAGNAIVAEYVALNMQVPFWLEEKLDHIQLELARRKQAVTSAALNRLHVQLGYKPDNPF